MIWVARLAPVIWAWLSAEKGPIARTVIDLAGDEVRDQLRAWIKSYFGRDAHRVSDDDRDLARVLFSRAADALRDELLGWVSSASLPQPPASADSVTMIDDVIDCIADPAATFADIVKTSTAYLRGS